MADAPAVDEYIAAQPETVRPILGELRRTIREVLPEATEKISYKMPAFEYGPHRTVYYAAWAKHIGIYPVYPSDHPIEAELAPYRHAKDTLRFPLDEPIPYDLVRRVVELIAGRPVR